MVKNGKIWGVTTLLLQTSQIEIHKVSINPNSSCSLHSHLHKWNAFYCISGELTIEVYKNAYDLIDKTILKAGDFTTVQPNEYHRFMTDNEPVEALEIYYTEGINVNDIIRKDVGKNNNTGKI